MPILHIEFDATGGSEFELGYRENGSTAPYTIVTGITASPIDQSVPLLVAYEFYIKKICSVDSSSWNVPGVAEYNPTCPVPTFTFLTRTGSNFSFDWTLDPSQPKYDVEIVSPSGVVIGTSRYDALASPSPLTITIPTLVNGTYRFRMRGVCGYIESSPTSNWSAYVDVNVIVSSCAAPSGINIL